ncbi:MAG TPA: hypothetical protein VGH23_10750 [Rhizomicrobium sp.]|jgi:hypothetical protein
MAIDARDQAALELMGVHAEVPAPTLRAALRDIERCRLTIRGSRNKYPAIRDSSRMLRENTAMRWCAHDRSLSFCIILPMTTAIARRLSLPGYGLVTWDKSAYIQVTWFLRPCPTKRFSSL